MGSYVMSDAERYRLLLDSSSEGQTQQPHESSSDFSDFPVGFLGVTAIVVLIIWAAWSLSSGSLKSIFSGV